MRYRRRAVLVANRFQLAERIGRGAMGEVWSAVDRKTGSEVAVKLAQAWSLEDAALVERFEREGEVLERLRSPYICALVARGRTADGVPYLVMEKLEGETLEALLHREQYLPLAEVGRIGAEILQGLVVAHAAGVVHRDVSPANVFLHGRVGSRTAVAKLIDFGIAKSASATGPRTTGKTTMGTLPFIAPEQLGDSARAGPRADLYAVGAIAFFALTGRPPFGDAKGTRLVALKKEHDPPTIDEVTGETWPAALKSFLAKTLARSPAKRYPSAEVALAALQLASRGRGPALEVPTPEPGATATLTLSPKSPRGR